jgi:hypothetical protein
MSPDRYRALVRVIGLLFTPLRPDAGVPWGDGLEAWRDGYYAGLWAAIHEVDERTPRRARRRAM